MADGQTYRSIKTNNIFNHTEIYYKCVDSFNLLLRTKFKLRYKWEEKYAHAHQSIFFLGLNCRLKMK